jgi:hypothetical protein
MAAAANNRLRKAKAVDREVGPERTKHKQAGADLRREFDSVTTRFRAVSDRARQTESGNRPQFREQEKLFTA